MCLATTLFFYSIRPSHSLWCNINCVFLSRGQCHSLLPVWTVNFRRLSCCMQTDGISFGNCVCSPAKLCAGQRRWGKKALSLSLTLSLLVSYFTRFIWVTYSPLRLTHHWGTGVNIPKHLKVYTSRLLHTHTNKQTKRDMHTQHTHNRGKKKQFIYTRTLRWFDKPYDRYSLHSSEKDRMT